MSHPDVEIITYGGGDYLRMVFNAISMLFYGEQAESALIQPLCMIAATIGAAWGIGKLCFQSSYLDAFITQYFLPMLIIPSLFIIPQARVHIIDKIQDKPLVVDHVPYLFAKIGSLSSLLGYAMTKAIESVMHTPNDVKYASTGMIFGADTSLDFSRLRLNNPTLTQNLHHFTQQCIIYDVALGRYSMDELKKSTDLLNFLKDKTSKVRMIPYTHLGDKKMEYLSCVDSLAEMSPLFDKEVKHYTKHEILKKLPISYQTLLDFQKKSQEGIASQLASANTNEVSKNIIVVNAFNDAATRFAAERTKATWRSNLLTTGSYAGSALVTLRNVFEALIYATFIFILPLSLLPGGMKFLFSWVFLNVWIQLWPPLYAILNYISTVSAQKLAQSTIGDMPLGYSLQTSEGFQDLALEVAGVSGYCSIFVPIISFYILQNIRQLAHLPGSLLSPFQSAASTAAGELSTGNYSFGNTHMGQMSYDNQTAFQHNSAPTLSTGFFTDNHGTHQVKYGSDLLTVNQDPSNLYTSISTAEAYTNSLQKAEQHAQTQVDTAQNLFSQNHAVAERSTADLIQHVASSEMYSNGYASSDALSVQESANYVKNAAENWGHDHGLGARESLEHFAGLGFNLFAKVGHNENCAAMSDEARRSSESIVNSEDFQRHYQNVLNSSHNEAMNLSTDEGKRFSEGYLTSMENLKSSQEQLSSALSTMDQISENLSYVESNTNTINTNLNTDFCNWLSERGALSALNDRNREQELNTLRDQFIEEKCHAEIGGLEHYKEPSAITNHSLNTEQEWKSLAQNIQQKAASSHLSYGQTADSAQGVISQYDALNGSVTHTLQSQEQKVDTTQASLIDGFNAENQKIGIDRLNGRMDQNTQRLNDYLNERCQEVRSWFDEIANP